MQLIHRESRNGIRGHSRPTEPQQNTSRRATTLTPTGPAVGRERPRRFHVRTVLSCLLMAASLFLLADVACPDILDVLVIASGAADLYTTEWALRASPSLHEQNPLMQSPAARIGLKTLGTVGTVAGSRYLIRHGHPRAAKVVKVAVIALWSGLAAQNAIRARSGR
jgi:hypothetical protein